MAQPASGVGGFKEERLLAWHLDMGYISHFNSDWGELPVCGVALQRAGGGSGMQMLSPPLSDLMAVWWKFPE